MYEGPCKLWTWHGLVKGTRRRAMAKSVLGMFRFVVLGFKEFARVV